jgi:hypothetical protein
MNWFQKNFKTLIYSAFLVPILTVAVVSISHVTKWYGLSNPVSWAIYLSVGIEIAALSALAAISAKMGRKVYLPFAIVTLIQFIGNIFFAYQYIDVNSQTFKDWMDLVNPVVSFLGVESGDPVGHKRFLALFAGGMLPLISLSFLHMLVKFEEDEKKIEIEPIIDIDALSIVAGKKEAELDKEKWTPTEDDLKKIEDVLLHRPAPIFKISEPKEDIVNVEPSNISQNASEMMITTDEDIIKSIPKDDDISDWDVTLMDGLEEEDDIQNITQSTPLDSKINRLSYIKRDA